MILMIKMMMLMKMKMMKIMMMMMMMMIMMIMIRGRRIVKKLEYRIQWNFATRDPAEREIRL